MIQFYIALIDWVNAVFIPLGMMISIGSFLALWMSVIISRLTAFDQAKMAACRAIARFSHHANARTHNEMINIRREIAEEFFLLNGEFVRLRQTHACSHMLYFIDRLQEAPWGDPTENQFPLDPLPEQQYQERLANYVSIFAKMIFDERPLKCPLITLRGYVKSTEFLGRVPKIELQKREQKAWEEIKRGREERAARAEARNNNVGQV